MTDFGMFVLAAILVAAFGGPLWAVGLCAVIAAVIAIFS